MKVVILGAGGHGQVVCDALLAGGEAELGGFVDDNPALANTHVMGFPVAASLAAFGPPKSVRFVAAIGSNAVRRRCFDRAVALGYEAYSVVHPRAVLGRGCVVGRGVVVLANVVVNVHTRLGDNVILNTACSVDHDCAIGAHAHVAPGARLGGGVTVGEGTLVGIGSSILPYTAVGAGCVVAAGAAVVRPVGDYRVAAGVPARVVRKRPKGDATI